MKSQKLQNSA